MTDYYIADPLIKLLAIKLYEHSTQRGEKVTNWNMTPWTVLADEDRDIFRSMARGDAPLSNG